MPSDEQAGLRIDAARLHPVSVLIGVPLVQLVRALVVPAFAIIAGGRGGERTTLLLMLVLVVGLLVRVLAWRRFQWSFDGESIRVEQGVLSRSRRIVDIARVQQVELDRPFAQRLLGMATLRIDTAGSDSGPEVELRVLRLADALALRRALQPRLLAGLGSGPRAVAEAGAEDGPVGPDVHDDTRADTPSGGPVEIEIVRLPLRRVALASVTGVQLLLAPALLVGLFQLAGERTEELLDAVVAWLMELQAGAAAPGLRVWLAGAVALAVVSVLTTLVVAIVRDGGFVVLRVGDDLVLRRGLLGTRESTVPLRRVQVVRITANPLRRALGVASLRIHSAGGSSGGGEGGSSAGRRAVIPLLAYGEAEELLGDLLPDLTSLPALRSHPPAARRRALLRRLRGLAAWYVPATIGWVILASSPLGTPSGNEMTVPVPEVVARLLAREDAAWAVPLAVGLLLSVVQVLLAHAEYRALAHGSDERVVIARDGTLSRTLSVAPLERLQGVTGLRSLFQERRHLATVRAHVAGPGGDVVVLDADAADAEVLRRRLEAAAVGARVGTRPARPAGPARSGPTDGLSSPRGS
jgi:putative membrane protein